GIRNPRSMAARDREHRADESEARSQVAGDPEAGDEDEEKRPNTGEKQRRARIEPHQNGRQHGASEHGNHVLYPHRDEPLRAGVYLPDSKCGLGTWLGPSMVARLADPVFLSSQLSHATIPRLSADKGVSVWTPLNDVCWELF